MKTVEVQLIEPKGENAYDGTFWVEGGIELFLTEDIISLGDDEFSLKEAEFLAGALLKAVELGREYLDENLYDGKGRQIVKTAKALDKLPEGTVIRDDEKDILTKLNGGWKWTGRDEFGTPNYAIDGEEIQDALPAIVIWNPKLEDE